MGREAKQTAWLIASLVLIWGLCWPIYKVALSYTPPILFAGMRTLFGGVLMALFLLPHWKRIEWRKNWLIYCISAFFNTFLFYGMQTVGLVYLPGGLFSVLVYLQPVLIGVFAWIWLGEKMTALKGGGLVIGFLGVAAISADGFTGSISLFGVVLALLTAIAWALGVIYVKKVSPKVDSLWLIAMQCVIGGLVLSGLGLGMEDVASIEWNGLYLLGLLYGTVLGVPIAFLLYYKLVNEGEASKVASFTFLVPLIAVLIGTIFLKEAVTVGLCIGLVLIVFSIYLVNRPSKQGKSGKQSLTKPGMTGTDNM
ncbi:DMT family transporter [Brevibacillus sp. TJ4]|uniref:DMT family transporter n=1 Tax=Brevibacillus sp. TJ4 TaxID=3234853 RepID=UPI0037D0571A